jgi:hypothetical protein
VRAVERAFSFSEHERQIDGRTGPSSAKRFNKARQQRPHVRPHTSGTLKMTSTKLVLVALAALTLSTSLTFADNPMLPGIGQIEVPAGTPSGSGNPLTPGIDQIQVPNNAPSGGSSSGGSAPQGGSSSSQDVGPIAGAVIGCLVAGTPIEFPNDLYLTNKGTAPLKAGTKLKFAVQSTGAKGALLLNTDIAVGAQVKVADVLNGGADAGAPCTAKVI